jgi:hypothetical protein
LTWSHYRKTTFAQLIKTQKADGCWEPRNAAFGTVFSTAVCLSILQLEKESLPFYQRSGR